MCLKTLLGLFLSTACVVTVAASTAGADPVALDPGEAALVRTATADLAAYWTFDEGAGTTAYDYSGHGNSGIFIGNAKWADGKYGKALYFDGSKSWVEVPDGSWNKSSPVTFTVWYKREAGRGAVFEHELSGAVRGAFLFDGSHFGMYDGALTDTGVTVQTAGGDWQFAAITLTDTEVTGYLDGIRNTTKSIKGLPKISGPFNIGARGSVGDQSFKGWIGDTAIYNRALSGEEIRALYDTYLAGLTPSTHSGLQVVDVSLPKLLYAPGESALARVVIKNFTKQPQSGSLRLKVVSLLADERSLPALPVKLPAGGVAMLDVPVKFGDESYGCALRANVKFGDADHLGDSISSRPFAVSDSVWKVGIGAPLASAQIGNESPAEIAAALKQAKADYCNWLEMFFWAPDDWGDMTPTRDWWYSGQEAYFIRHDSLKSLIDQAHGYGMKAITYGKNTSAGPDGWELARRHPDWFLQANILRPSGIYDVADLDNWNKPHETKGYKPAAGTWQWLYPDLRKPAPLDWGIDQIIGSAKEFGWDGVRFDGHFTVPNDEASTYNMRRLKERVWKDDPNFLFGFNYSYSPQGNAGYNHEMQEAMNGGGMWMQEAIGSWKYTEVARYTSWNHYATNELKVAKQIEALGGNYHCIWRLTPDARGLYKFIYGLIAGAHSVYSIHNKLDGCANWGEFMTRWSAFLWDQRLHPMENPAARITVNSQAPLLWEPLAQEFVESAHRKFWVIHLVNPPMTDDIDKTDVPPPPKPALAPMPEPDADGSPAVKPAPEVPQLKPTTFPLAPPVENVSVALKPPAGERIARITLVRPDTDPFQNDIAVSGPNPTVTVPRVANWDMLIVELNGNYTVPAAAPKFSAPPDMAQVNAMRQAAASGAAAAVSNDPLKPSSNFAVGPNQELWETNTGFWNIWGDGVADPDAGDGLAQHAGSRGGSMGRTWMGEFTPGRFHVRFRFKWTGPDAAQAVANLVIHSEATGDVTHQQFSLNDTSSTGHKPGVYQDHVADMDLKLGGHIHCYISVPAVKDAKFDVYLDHIVTEQVQRYSDPDMAAWAKPIARPADIRVPEGASPKKILEVTGLYWQPYAIGSAVDVTTSYNPPYTYEDLYKYDAVIMTDAEFSGWYQGRELYRNYVNDGGRLIILGGFCELTRNWKKTYFDDILPVAINGEGAIVACDPPAALGEAQGHPYAGNPLLFWRHDVTAKPDAQVMAWAGSQPIATRRRFGKGQVVLFSGTVLGDPAAGQTPFWKSEAWTNLVRRMVNG